MDSLHMMSKTLGADMSQPIEITLTIVAQHFSRALDSVGSTTLPFITFGPSFFLSMSVRLFSKHFSYLKEEATGGVGYITASGYVLG